ncbi:MAG: type II secretion system F family protein [Haloarculaceae archaeon]
MSAFAADQAMAAGVTNWAGALATGGLNPVGLVPLATGGLNPVGLVPLAAAAMVVALVPLSSAYRPLDTGLTRVSRRYFGRYVSADAPERTRRLRAAYVDETYRSYAAKTYLLTALAAVAGSILGVYVFGAGLLVLPAVGDFIDTLPDAMAGALGRPELEPDLSGRGVFAVLAGGGVLSGAVVGGFTYWYRWERPRSRAEIRRRGINEGLPRTVAFVYALSRGGMAVPEVFRTLAHNRQVYGHGADEISVAVREMDLFGSDIITAVRRVSARTPSDQFKTFSENLASVLQSGQSLSEFLREQYDRYRDEALDRQQEVLELLATIAEAYVTVLVAGTLFLMTILLVFGLTTTRTINFLRLLAYVLIPLGNVLFIVYLDGKLDLLGVARGSDTGALREATSNHWPSLSAVDTADNEDAAVDAGDGADHPDRAGASGSRAAVASTDGGNEADATASGNSGADSGAPFSPGGPSTARENRRRLALYGRFESVKTVLRRPLGTLLWNPTTILYLTVPVAVLSVALRFPNTVSAGAVRPRALDDVLIQAALLVLASFAVVWEIYSRRIRRMEAALPELLERLASLNEAGMSVVESFDRVREGDLGVLSAEVERVWRDLQYGATVDDALRRFGLRVRTTATTRVVTLLTNALRASGNLAPILRIAGEQAKSELKLRRQRRQQMLTYLVVIYVSFFVFLVIILAVKEVLVPSLPTNVPTPSAEETARLGVDAQQFTHIATVDKAAYTLVFFHTALIQAVFSGFIGGQLGEGSLKDGAKHATIMLGLAYVAFVLLSSPVAQVTLADQSTAGDAVVVEGVSLSEGGFVVVRARTPQGEVIGHSAYLEPGKHEDVRVPIDRTYSDQMTLFAAAYADGDGDEEFDGVGADTPDSPYQSSGEPVYDRAAVTRSESGSAGRLSPSAVEPLALTPAVHRVAPPGADTLDARTASR